MSSAALAVAVTTFLASAVEGIEMVAIVAGVGVTRGWRAAIAGAAGGLVVLAVLVAVFGLALTAIPIGILRLVVGALLLIVGLNWLRKGIRRLAAQGLRGSGPGDPGPTEEEEVPRDRRDWTGFVLAFKGVLLEGLEVAFIVVTFGGTSNQLGVAVVAAIGALVLVAAFGLAIQPLVRRIPRSALQLAVGLLLTTFGTFWAVEGVGVDWPGSDAAIVGLLGLYVVVAAGYLAVERAGWLPRTAAGAASG
ncbi:MAG TPA: hypothetical protein VKK19_19575 [Candidatus Dormibacteraeota bacterium]|nr:hypothetical protein [Candidatus Dormibacteraeota bacterium]